MAEQAKLTGPDFGAGVDASTVRDGESLLGHANGEAWLHLGEEQSLHGGRAQQRTRARGRVANYRVVAVGAWRQGVGTLESSGHIRDVMKFRALQTDRCKSQGVRATIEAIRRSGAGGEQCRNQDNPASRQSKAAGARKNRSTGRAARTATIRATETVRPHRVVER